MKKRILLFIFLFFTTSIFSSEIIFPNPSHKKVLGNGNLNYVIKISPEKLPFKVNYVDWVSISKNTDLTKDQKWGIDYLVNYYDGVPPEIKNWIISILISGKNYYQYFYEKGIIDKKEYLLKCDEVDLVCESIWFFAREIEKENNKNQIGY